jgi:hypothetical protein
MASITPPTTSPNVTEDILAFANRLYREYHTRCFWHCPRDLVITAELLPLVVKGLRAHGGRRGFILAGQLRQRATAPATPEKDPPECL